MKTALITGISGQDGAYLSDLLLSKGYEVFGTSRAPQNQSKFDRLKKLGNYERIKIFDRNQNVKDILKDCQANEIYNLEGQSSVAESFKKPFETIESNGYSTLQWLEEVRNSEERIKFYQASSTDIFGESLNFSVDEKSKCNPKSPYAVSKLFSHHITQNYREAYDLFACCGILSNHESALRGEQYVTQKIARSVVAIERGELACLEIGNLSVRRDWGHAKDYVRGMYEMLQQEKADDYILATGRLHTVRQLVDAAFAVVGKAIVWQGAGLDELGRCAESSKVLVKVNKKFYRPTDISKFMGSPLKAMNDLGWEPTITFENLIKEMVESHLNL
jgi:GDPmannose 4,6-dehydratase